MGEIIKAALAAKGLSQKEFAEIIHVTPQAVSKWINGESRPTQDNVIMIYKVLGVDLTREVTRQKNRCSMINMEHIELKDINNYEKAVNEAASLLEKARIESNYSHSVYKLLTWLLPAVVGLTFHQMLNAKKDEEVDYDRIFFNLKDYLDNECPHITRGLYENYLEYNFYLMGMDLFESFDEYTIPDHEYCEAAMEDWYRFLSALVKSPASVIYCELRVAIAELIETFE